MILDKTLNLNLFSSTIVDYNKAYLVELKELNEIMYMIGTWLQLLCCPILVCELGGARPLGCANPTISYSIEGMGNPHYPSSDQIKYTTWLLISLAAKGKDKQFLLHTYSSPLLGHQLP